MGEMALYVKGKVSTRYAVVELAYGGRACACPPPARNASPVRLALLGRWAGLAVAGGLRRGGLE